MTTTHDALIQRIAAQVLPAVGRPGQWSPEQWTPPSLERGLGPFMDQTLLKANATREQVATLCDGALKHRFASVCVNSCWTALCAERLEGSGVRVCTVVGFPLGAMATEAKAFETLSAVRAGAEEIDMVLNVGWLLAGDWRAVFDDIAAVVKAAEKRPVKVILETALIDDERKVAACHLSKAAGAAFVKTSTGFADKGATAEDVALMRRVVGPSVGVKASGGIRDAATSRAMIAAGANRLGVSAGVQIVQGESGQGGY